MKKLSFLICVIFILFLLSSCDTTCQKLGGHDLQYVTDNLTHWQECVRDGCDYKTKSATHTGGTATCQEMATCQVCRTKYGTYGDHDEGYISLGEEGHVYGCSLSTCDKYQMFSEAHCGGTATCNQIAQCEKCGDSYGELAQHVYDESINGGVCVHCGTSYFEETVEFRLGEDGKSYILYSAQNYKSESIVIPAEYNGLPVTEIGIVAFHMNKYVETVILPNTIKIINEGAFDSSGIKSITIPNSVEIIGIGAFSCSKLETISFGSGIKEIGTGAFDGSNIKNCTIPGSVEKIEPIFGSCSQLESVILLDGIKYIDREVFIECPNLKTILLPNTLESVGYNRFVDLPALEYNVYGGLKYLGTTTNPYFALVGSTGEPHAVMHPDTEYCINYTMVDCENSSSIVSIVIGPKLRIVESRALADMDSLETITVAPGTTNFYVVNNILVDARSNKPVLGCKNSIVPTDGSLSEIGLEIFDYNDTIESIYIPKGVKIIHMNFDELYKLEQLVIGADVERLIIYGNYDGCKEKEPEKTCFCVYHCHTEEEWQQVVVEYTFNRNAMFRTVDCYGDHATHYFYSETEPTTEGNYWHYVDGVPTPW